MKLEGLESRNLLSTVPAAPLASAHAAAAHVRHLEGKGLGHSARTTPRHTAALGNATIGITEAATVSPFRSRGGVTAAATPASAPYTPAQIRHAYGIDQLSQTGAGQTIAIVDAYDDPTIASDLATFDQAFGLPAANFTKIDLASGTPVYNQGWAGEIALDVEWAHAVAPGANIVLVEAASSSMSDLMTAVDTAVGTGAKQVSMSWGGGEFSGMPTYDAHFKVPGVTFTASTGDNGAAVNYPAASPYVVAVGGTSLQLDSSGNRISETAWSGSGGGTSSYYIRPSYQTGFQAASKRGVPDVAYNADPSTGYYVYDSSSGGTWWQVGGTSAAAPQWAGLTALVNQGRAAAGKASLGSGYTYGTNQVLYKLAGGSSYTNPNGDFLDITSGSNGYSTTTGYDVVTGLGSPVANKLVPDLINA